MNMDKKTHPTAEAIEQRNRALSYIRQWGDPILRSVAPVVTNFDDRLESTSRQMISLMQAAMGVGLASVQLGIMERMFVYEVISGESHVVVNPEIDILDSTEIVAIEGCLSLPRVQVEVPRARMVRLRAYTLQGELFEREAEEVEARVIQHELDHLNGILILARTSPESKREALRILRGGEPTVLPPDRGE